MSRGTYGLRVGADPEPGASRTGALIGIGATLLLFVGIWRLDRSADHQSTFMPDLEARYRARGIDPRTVF
jgi:hypothetical protein